MNDAYRMGLMHGQFDSMTQGERMELRVRRMIEWRIWFEATIGRAWLPMLGKRHHLQWPEVPEAAKERFCDGWGCTKKVPAGRLVCPWCGRMETAPGFGWMDALYAPRKTESVGNGIAKTVYEAEGHGECHRIVEQYIRISEEALEMEPLELKVELPAETVRAWLEAQGVTGDS